MVNADPMLGLLLGSYQVAELLGSGGMGRVYRAVQPRIGAEVAIKVLSREAAENPDTVARFVAEARALSVIRHDGIVAALDHGHTADGRPYLVMEYVAGSALAAIMDRRGALPMGSLGRLVIEVLKAVGAAHDKGVVHRDLKPENVIVTPAGHAKVLDFGIAKLAPPLPSRAPTTRSGSLVGTPAYMSPEQASGEKVDLRSDLYSIGVLLFEGAVGRPPFVATTLFELLRQHIEERPPAPRSLRRAIPPALEAVILRALEKDPARRFQSAQEMATALKSALHDLPPAETLPLDAPRAARISQSPPWRWMATGAALLLLAFATIALVRYTRKKPAPDPGPVPSPSPRNVDADADANVNVSVPDSGPTVGATIRSAPPDPRHFDVGRFLPRALTHARTIHPDAELHSLLAVGVAPDGLVDLTDPTRASHVSYLFCSRAHPAQPLTVQALADSVHIVPGTGISCDVTPRPERPSCTLRAVWRQAKSRGASPSHLATLQLAGTRWRFEQPGTRFEPLRLDDTCP